MTLVRNPLFARWFIRWGARNEARGNDRLRAETVAGLTGLVVEVGAGTGLNFRHYPPGVSEVVAVEPEPTLRAKAVEAASAAAVPVGVVDGTADALPLADASAAAVVVTGVLCSVPDPSAALAEFRRVLAPAGELRFYEHVRAGRGVLAVFQDLAVPLWRRLMGGCRPNRRTLRLIESAGFTVAAVREFRFPRDAKVSVVGPRILGAARDLTR
jgi:ubiquinone/menaquinone biosynthesis C-methylase UbiE